MSVAQVIIEKYLLTYTRIKEYQCTWTCKFLRDQTHKVGVALYSPEFQTDEYTWNIEIYFGGFDDDSRDYVCARLFLYQNRINIPLSFKAAIKLSIVDKNSKEHIKQNMIRGKENSSKDYFRINKRDDLLSSLDFLPNDELTLAWRISLYPDDADHTIYSEITDKPWSMSQCHRAQMSNFARIFDNPEYSDFQFIVGETRIKVHKCILAAHSPVFAAMFRNDMLEKNKNEVEIKDVDVHVMRQLLRFIYVGEVEEIDDFADKLFIAGDKYELDNLKELCEQKLIERLNLQNLYETLRFVDQFDAIKLKSVIIQFIIQNSKKLSTMEEFKKSIETLSSSTLAQVVCAFMAKSE